MMGRPPIGEQAMTAAERQRRRRKRLRNSRCRAERDQETLEEKFERAEKNQFEYAEALYDYSNALIHHRQRFATDQEFRAWLGENEWYHFERENDAALLIKRELDLDDWDKVVDIWKIVTDLIEFEPEPIVTDDVTKDDDTPIVEDVTIGDEE
jgi:hypothetical protein